MDWHDTVIYVRAVHFAATVLTAGAVFFSVLIAAPALAKYGSANGARAFRSRLAVIAWTSLALCVVSGAAWLVLTAQAMSKQPLPQVWSQGVIWTVLLQTHFGNDWLVRLVIAGLLAGIFARLLKLDRNGPPWLATAALVLASALIGSLAWAGHAIGASGIEGIVHPVADILHLVAAAAWVGTLPLLVLLFAATQRDAAAVAIAQIATSRFSTLGIVSVGTLLATGIVNSWYLVGSVTALVGTSYGQVLLVKVALFFGMVGIAAVNRFRLTPQLASAETAGAALGKLRRNAGIETLGGAAILFLVAMLGTMPPAGHAHHHPVYGAIPAEAAFVHIHTEQGMADVTIMPGRAGTARATIRLWDADFGALAAKDVTVTLTPPTAGSAPIMHYASQDADDAWQADDIELSQPGVWKVSVGVVLGPDKRLALDAPIVIEPGQ